MSIRDAIAGAGRNRHTIILTAREDDGTVETREAEPYSYRFEAGREFFYCYDIDKKAIRKFAFAKTISVEETDNTFDPRWPVEV